MPEGGSAAAGQHEQVVARDVPVLLGQKSSEKLDSPVPIAPKGKARPPSQHEMRANHRTTSSLDPRITRLKDRNGFSLPTSATTVSIVWKDVKPGIFCPCASPTGFTLKPPCQQVFPGPEDNIPKQLRDVVPKPSWYVLLETLEDFAWTADAMQRESSCRKVRSSYCCCLVEGDVKSERDLEDTLRVEIRALQHGFLESHKDMLGGIVELYFREWEPPDLLDNACKYGCLGCCCIGLFEGWCFEKPQVKWLEVRRPDPPPSSRKPSKPRR